MRITVKQIMEAGDVRPFTIVYSTPYGNREVTGLVTETRVDRTKDTMSKYLYDIRHADNNWCDPATVENRVMVNWFGTFILCEPFVFPEKQDFADITDYWYEDE